MKPKARLDAIVVGASAGAIEALSVILPTLPKGFSAALIVVVHIPSDRASKLAELFQARCQVIVKEAEDKEPIEAGTVYFAPPDYHLLVNSDRRLSLSSEEPVLFSRPSIDVLFESAADAFGENLAGIILSGANSDGAAGLRNVCDSGGIAIVQTPDTAYAGTMPQAAKDACPEASLLDLNRISSAIQVLALQGAR